MFPMFLMTIACGLTGYLLDCQHIYIALWIDSALTAMPFFMLGYFIRSKTDLLNETLSKKHLQLSVLSLLMLLFAVWLDEIQGVHEIYYGSNEYEVNAFSLYAGGAFGMLFVLLISKRVNSLPVVSYVGRYSIVVLLTHLLYLFLFRNILYQLGIQQENVWLNLLLSGIIILLEIPTISFCIKIFPYCFAQKDLWK